MSDELRDKAMADWAARMAESSLRRHGERSGLVLWVVSASFVFLLLAMLVATSSAEAPKAKPKAKTPVAPLKMLGVDLDKLPPDLMEAIAGEIGNRMLDDDAFRRKYNAMMRKAMGPSRHRALKIKMALDENPGMGPLKRRITIRNIH